MKTKKKICLGSPKVPQENIKKIEENIYEVKSCSSTEIYHVDMSIGVCSCMSGKSGYLCKHQKSIVLYDHLQCDSLYQGTPRESYKYACLALGITKAPKISFFKDFLVDSCADSRINNCNHPCSSSSTSAITNPPLERNVECEFESPYDGIAESMENANKAKVLLDTATDIIKTKLDMGAEESIKALEKFVFTLSHAHSSSQVQSILHTAGKSSVTYKNSGRRISCQPTTLSRRKAGAPRCAAPLTKGRKPNGISHPPLKRKRSLASSIFSNVPNAKSH